ncbi:MAG: CsbD family protein [Actinomycetota bacterium]
MGEKMDEAKGKAKQAVGDATDDDDLKREGKMDEVGAKVKEKTGDAVDAVKDKTKQLTDDDR